jgi:hypothetical protein
VTSLARVSMVVALTMDINDGVARQQVLEECNPVVLKLILTLVLVGRFPPELVVVKSILLAFLLSIRNSQNYNILE